MKNTILSLLALCLFAAPVFAQDAAPRKKVLYFSYSNGFQHDPVKLVDGGPSVSDVAMVELGKKHGYEVVCTKDGAVFDGDLDQYAAFAFYTSGNLSNDPDENKPGARITDTGREKFFAAIRAGKGYLGFHSANDTWRSGGDNYVNDPPEKINPYIKIVGAEFTSHGPQQEADVIITQPAALPWFKSKGEKFRYYDEWYAFKNFADDMHVLAVLDTEGMKGDQYRRPPFPMVWARMEGKGRVVFSGLGHRNEYWKDEHMMEMVNDLLQYAMGEGEIDITPNLEKTAPGAKTLKNN